MYCANRSQGVHVQASAQLVSSPKENEVDVAAPPRAARSHSASVGSRNFVVPRYWFSFPMKLEEVQLDPVVPPQMSFQLTISTGQSRPQLVKYEGLLPITATHCRCVTSVEPR
jgi:hypothetical protein